MGRGYPRRWSSWARHHGEQHKVNDNDERMVRKGARNTVSSKRNSDITRQMCERGDALTIMYPFMKKNNHQ
jgi:hypothetical protein